MQKLYVYAGQLVQLPEHIGECTELLELYAGTNQIKVIPKSIGGCQQLEILSIGKIQFRRFLLKSENVKT